MKSTILLINLPQTEFGQRLPSSHLPSKRLQQMQALLSNEANLVEILDADFYAMNFFKILRVIRRHAPQAIWVAEQSDSAMSKILRTQLLATMPHVRWLSESVTLA